MRGAVEGVFWQETALVSFLIGNLKNCSKDNGRKGFCNYFFAFSVRDFSER